MTLGIYDIGDLHVHVYNDIGDLHVHVNNDIGDLHVHVYNDIGDLHVHVYNDIGDLHVILLTTNFVYRRLDYRILRVYKHFLVHYFSHSSLQQVHYIDKILLIFFLFCIICISLRVLNHSLRAISSLLSRKPNKNSANIPEIFMEILWINEN